MSKWTENDNLIIVKCLNEANEDGRTMGVYPEIARLINHSAESIRKHAMNDLHLPNIKNNIQSDARLIQHKLQLDNIDDDLKNIKDLALTNFREKYKAFQVVSKKIIVCGDFHFPYYNRSTLRFLIRNGVGCDLLIAGDFMDWSSLANQKKRLDVNESSEAILIGMRRLMKLLLEHFNIIYLMPGNHDYRIEVMSEGKLSWKMLFIEFMDLYPDRFKIIDFPRVELNEDWVVLHPDTYRKVPGSVARSFAEIEMKNTICGHSHTTCQAQAENGKYAFDIGGCVDGDLVAYRWYTCKPYGEWKNGFIKLENDKFQLFTEGNNF